VLLLIVAGCASPPADTVPRRTDPVVSRPSDPVPAPTPVPTPSPVGPAPRPLTPEREAVLDTARRFLGVRYQYGGSDVDGLDCSALMVAVFSEHGVSIPRTAAQQFEAGAPIPPKGLRPGDLVFFSDGRRIHHVGMYLGRWQFIHASSDRGEVRVDSLASGYFRRHYAGARSFLDGSAAR